MGHGASTLSRPILMNDRMSRAGGFVPSRPPSRILICELNEDGTTGGSHQALKHLTLRIDEDRFEPVLLFYEQNRVAEQLESEGIEVHIWDHIREEERSSGSSDRVFEKLRGFWRGIWRRVRFLCHHEIDLVHLNNHPATGHEDWLPATRLVGSPCLSHLRGRFGSRDRWGRRVLSRRYHHFIAVSDHIRREALAGGIPDESLTRIYDGVPLEAIRAEARETDPSSTREAMGVPQGAFLVVMVGHLHKWKGQAQVLKAIARLDPDQRCELRLVFVGEAPDTSSRIELSRMTDQLGLGDQVTFLGARSDIPALMDAADVVLHASTDPEPFGLVVVEAMALGKAVLASSLGGPAEIIDEGSGLLADPRDPEDYASALSRLMRSPELRMKLGRQARLRAREFRPDRYAQKVQKIWSDTLTDSDDATQEASGADERHEGEQSVPNEHRRRVGHQRKRPVSGVRRSPILFVHYGEDWIRGSERCLLDLLEHIDRTKYSPVVWCNARVMQDAVGELDVPVYRDRFSILFDWTRPRFDIANFLKLIRKGQALVDRHGINLIHANSGAPVQWMTPVARSARIPIVSHLHANYNLHDRSLMGLHFPTIAVGVSHIVLEGLLRDGMDRNRSRVIYNAVDIQRLESHTDTHGVPVVDIPNEALAVVTIGSLIHRKGFDLLLEAFAQVARTQDNHVQLLIAGEGPKRDDLQRQAEDLRIDDRVSFLGERDDVGALLSHVADIAVCSSRAEAFGLTILEALACGVPVVSTRVPGAELAVGDKEAGIIVPCEDVAALAQGITCLLQDPEMRRAMGKKGRERIRDHFSVERYVRDFEALYAELLGWPGQQFEWTGPSMGAQPLRRLVLSSLSNRLLPEGTT